MSGGNSPVSTLERLDTADQNKHRWSVVENPQNHVFDGLVNGPSLRLIGLRLQRRSIWSKCSVGPMANYLGFHSKTYTILILLASLQVIFTYDFMTAVLPKEVDIAAAVLTLISFVVLSFDLGLNVYLFGRHYLISSFIVVDGVVLLCVIPEILVSLGLSNGNDVVGTMLGIPTCCMRHDVIPSWKLFQVLRWTRCVKLFDQILSGLSIFHGSHSSYKQVQMKHLRCASLAPDDSSISSMASAVSVVIFQRLVCVSMITIIIILMPLSLMSSPREVSVSEFVLDYSLQTENISHIQYFLSLPESHRVDYNAKLIRLTLGGKLWLEDSSNILSTLRPLETIKYQRSINEIVINNRKVNQMAAGCAVLLNLLLASMLLLVNYLIMCDVYRLSVAPLERMNDFLTDIHQFGYSVTSRCLRQSVAVLRHMDSIRDWLGVSSDLSDPRYEAAFVETSVKKMGALLDVSFGIAGSEIVSRNLRLALGDINVMIPGNKIRGVFSFCDIRNFTELTQVLQEEIMLFVNAIAMHVHRLVVHHGGHPNKNIGDAFLCVWKDPSDSREKDIAKHCLRCAIETLWSIHNEPRTSFFASKAGLPMVEMGWGIHIGWAIEGAIGSEHKVDPTYLSPHVNLSSRLEGATRMYKVPILLSSDFFYALPHDYQTHCRLIDKVAPKGVWDPVGVYTYKEYLPYKVLGIPPPIASPPGSPLKDNEQLNLVQQVFFNFGMMNITQRPKITTICIDRVGGAANTIAKVRAMNTRLDMMTYPQYCPLGPLNKSARSMVSKHGSDSSTNDGLDASLRRTSTPSLGRLVSDLHNRPNCIPGHRQVGNGVANDDSPTKLDVARGSSFNRSGGDISEHSNMMDLVWESALLDYFEGHWKEAKEKFEQSLTIMTNYGPARTLLDYMKSHNFVSPREWAGFRSLDSK